MGKKASHQAVKGQVTRLQGQQRNHLCQEPWTQRHPIRTTRFRSSQACDPKLWGSPKRHRLDTPTRYITRASEPRFRSSEALSGTWWQVKDSNLRSFRDGFTVPGLQARDQRKRLTGNNFRAYSPQTADVNHLQPDNSAGQIRPTRSNAVMLEIALHLAFTDPQTLRTSRSRRTSRQSSSTDRKST